MHRERDIVQPPRVRKRPAMKLRLWPMVIRCALPLQQPDLTLKPAGWLIRSARNYSIYLKKRRTKKRIRALVDENRRSKWNGFMDYHGRFRRTKMHSIIKYNKMKPKTVQMAVLVKKSNLYFKNKYSILFSFENQQKLIKNAMKWFFLLNIYR